MLHHGRTPTHSFPYLDGSGYPNGLKGDELDLETRLLTVVDIYDALVATDRPSPSAQWSVLPQTKPQRLIALRILRR